MNGDGKILVVDDVPQNVRLLEAVLAPRGYEVVTATDGDGALRLVESEEPDLVLLDVVMPKLDGYEVCRRLRARPETAMLPVLMVTASVAEKAKVIEAGADDLIAKPFNQDEMLARVRSLLRIKRYHDTVEAQAAELLQLNRSLEGRVHAQVRELERMQKLRRFLSPQLADAIVSSGDDSILRSHRRKVAMFFADLRGWTSFVDTVEPEELMQVLGEFHRTIGGLVRRFDATVGFLEGDGVQLFFNDPTEVPDAALRAVRMGCALREEMEAELTPQWLKRGYELDFGAGIALGYATCGEVGFEGRSDYAAIGAVTNLASRLADEARAGEVLIAQRLYAEVEADVEVEPAREFTLKGFRQPMTAFNLVAVREPAGDVSAVASS
ncbi:MAG TPA: response regulator [Actinomycetota bacterium]|nr:response regulator [Actinomycetota bacterium]